MAALRPRIFRGRSAFFSSYRGRSTHKIACQFGTKLDGKIVGDIANPLNSTCENLVAALDLSTAEDLDKAIDPQKILLEVKMSAQTQSPAKTEFSIHPATLIGHVSLRISNLKNQIAFYQQTLGFKLHWREGNKAGLGAGGADLLLLTEEPDLKKYRRELARAVARLFAYKYRNHPTDHINIDIQINSFCAKPVSSQYFGDDAYRPDTCAARQCGEVSSKNRVIVQTFGTFPRFIEMIPKPDRFHYARINRGSVHKNLLG
jgi:catechol 2,3-dioxygenase-like lactoylglutathione lyase family enzyme